MTSIFTVASLAAYFLAAMLHFTPVSAHAYYEKPAVTEARYASIADTLAEVMLEETMPDSERLQVGLVMVSIGDVESYWRSDVVSCAASGDHGLAWGPWQTQLPKAKVCASTKSAARLAVGMVRDSFLACKDVPVPDRLSWYTDGGKWNASIERRERAHKRSSFRMNRALTWVKDHPFTVNVIPSSFIAIEVP